MSYVICFHLNLFCKQKELDKASTDVNLSVHDDKVGSEDGAIGYDSGKYKMHTGKKEPPKRAVTYDMGGISEGDTK